MAHLGFAARTVLTGGVGAAVAAYLLVLRPRQLRWGATDDEVRRTLPGDAVVVHPTFNATRAVTIEARPEDIWPWLVQMGLRRAGWYSYDWIDNLGKPSAETIVPELQDVHVDDLLPMSPGEKVGVWVKDFETARWLLWWDRKGDVTWLWVMDRVDDAHSRLISRVRMKYRWTSPVILFEIPFDVGDIIMMRKCMLGIKWRAERTGALLPAGGKGSQV